MNLPSIEETMASCEPYLDALDRILRASHDRYQSYDPEVLLEHDARAQAACTYCHIVAAAEREFDSDPNVRYTELNGGLKVWYFPDLNVVFRFKKMLEDGSTRNYPTQQAKDYDDGRNLEGLPPGPARLAAGYLLDPAGRYDRTQISLARGKGRIAWCAAVVPQEDRIDGVAWIDVTKQAALA